MNNPAPAASHEEGIIKAFVSPSKKARYLSLLESPKGRAKFLKGLDHFADLDGRYAKQVPPKYQTPQGIEIILKQRKAPLVCHVISTNDEIDNQDMLLSEALKNVVGSSIGTFISCIPGVLAYFEGEDANERFILERK